MNFKENINNEMVSLIANVYHNKGKLVIGTLGKLLYKNSEDIKYFKDITTSVKDSVVVMGRRTWFSIPLCYRPLPQRINVILTRNKELIMSSTEDTKFMTFEKFRKWASNKSDIFVIGGGEVYNMFLSLKDSDELKPKRLYITETKGEMEIDTKYISYIDTIPENYKLFSVSKKHLADFNLTFRFLMYKLIPGSVSNEHVYLKLMKNVLETGKVRQDRTNVGVLGVFGRQTEIDISSSIGLITTKRVPWKSCIEELLWFLRGDTDAKILSARGVKIWNDNSSRDFLDNKGLTDYREGVLGTSYGWQWRFCGAEYSQELADTSKIDTSLVGGVDQIQRIIDQLKNDPFSRRIILNSWNPVDNHQVALPPCHFVCQFYVEEDNSGVKHLSCHYIMRSNDLFLGAPWNIMSYAVLTYILAAKCGMKPSRLVYSCTDAHIYRNHVNEVKMQLAREVRSEPRLLLSPEVASKDFSELTIDDFDVVGYFPHPGIKGKMAV